jgi:hypothetical protein
VKRSMGTAVLLAAVVAVVSLVGSAVADPGGGDRVLRSELIGSNPDGPELFGATPGGAPWVVAASDVDARRDGRIDVQIEGLVIPGTGIGGVRTVTATLYCNAEAVDTTDAVTLSPEGDAEIHDTVAAAPDPCLVPAVLINPNGAVDPARYIAATGV